MKMQHISPQFLLTGAPVRRRLLRLGAMCVDFLLPPQCPVCRDPIIQNGQLCAKCWCDLDLIVTPYCDRLGIPFALPDNGVNISLRARANPPAYERARAAVLYNETARRLVHGLKYHDRHDLAALIAQLMIHAGADVLRNADLLIPVPLHWTRLWTRRFNQSSILSGHISKSRGIPVCTAGLARIRRTPRQVGLTSGQRKRNVAGAFAVSDRLKMAINGSNIVLIDDVLTTGATVEACTRTLKKAGAQRVDILTFALVADIIEGVR